MTEIEICNLALGLLGKSPITGFDAETEEARQAELFYAPCRDAVLEDRLWSFGKLRLVPDRNATAPAFQWACAFDLPANVLAVHSVDDGTGAWETPYEVVGRQILTDAAAINVVAKGRVEDTSLFTPGFCMALAARLGAEMAIPLTTNRQLQSDLWNLYATKLKMAGGADGLQGRTERTRTSRLARYR